MTWFWLNMPLAAAFFAAWVGVPLWLVLKHQDHAAKPVTAQAAAAPGPDGPAPLPVVAAAQRTGELAGV